MPNINLPTGNTIYVSAYEYYFLLKEEDMDEFFQSCIADNLGVQIDNPFSNSVSKGVLDKIEIPEIEDSTTQEDLEDFSL